MSNTNANFEMTGILLGQEARKRKTPQEKIAIIQQTMEPGMNVSHVARLHGIQPSLLFKWKKQYQEGSLTAVAAGEEVVPASELTAALKQVRELQRLLGKKTMEVEILKEAVEYGQSRKWIAHAPLLPKDGEEPWSAAPWACRVRSCHCGLTVLPTGRTSAVTGVMTKQTKKYCRLSSTSSAICRVMVIDACGASCASNVAQRDSHL